MRNIVFHQISCDIVFHVALNEGHGSLVRGGWLDLQACDLQRVTNSFRSTHHSAVALTTQHIFGGV